MGLFGATGLVMEMKGGKAVVCPVAFPSLHYTAWRVEPGVLVLGEAVALTVRVAL